MTLVILLVLLVFFLGLLTFNKLTKVDYIPTEFEYELIDYFKEIALNAEYSSKDKLQKTIKWKQPMMLFVVKEGEHIPQIKTIKKVIQTISELTLDGFKIELIEEKSKSNAILYLLNKDKVEEIDPSFFNGISGDFVGLSLATYNGRNNITSAKIFIDIEESIEIQKSVILEEITQSIGLMNDSEKYSNSIFYEKQMEENIVNVQYSAIDKDIIKLLYHRRMKSGLNNKEVERVIKRIFKNNEIELSGSKNSKNINLN